MNYKHLALQNYKRFCEKEGSEYIASEFALAIILKLIKKYKVKSILEVGLGIGSISDTVLEFASQHHYPLLYVGTEANEFCLDALKKNVGNYDKIELYNSISSIMNRKFDLIIVDGSDSDFEKITNFCKADTIVFIEGDRTLQTKSIMEYFPTAKHVNLVTLDRNRTYAHGTSTPESYMGGGQLIFIDPEAGRKLFWFKEKVSTYIKRKIRGV
jgi:hypothetical protein